MRRNCEKTRSGMSFGLVALSLVAAPVVAQEKAQVTTSAGALEEVIVTAQKRAENIQDVPISMSALAGADIEAKGLNGFRDWATYVPGITMFQGSSANRRGGPTAVIRGVSQTSAGQLNETSSQATTSYMIGQVPIFSSDPGLFDMDRIEVLRGPQGTLFGVASMGGTVRYIPNEARADAFEAKVRVDGGFYHGGGARYQADFMLNMPIVQDVFAVRLSGMHRHSDGYIDMYLLPLGDNNPSKIAINGMPLDTRQASGSSDGLLRDVNSSDTDGVRLSMTFTPTERLSLKAFTMWQKSTQDSKQFIDLNDQTGDWVVNRFAREPQADQFSISSLEASYDVGFGSLEYVGGFFQSELSETVDATTLISTFLNGTGTHAGVNVLDADGPGGLPADPWPSATVFPFETRSRIASHELRLQGQNKPLGSIGSHAFSFDYVVGLFYMNERRSGSWDISNPNWNSFKGSNTFPILDSQGLTLGSTAGGRYESKSAFTDLTLHLTEKLSLSAGVRYSDNHSDSAGVSVSVPRAADGATDGTRVTTPLTLQYGTVNDKSVTPRYGVQYRLDDQKMLYFTAAKGERMPTGTPNPNAFNTPGANDPVCRQLARNLGVEDDALNGTTTDTVWSYDLGLKSTWLDRRLLVNVSLFYLDWTNLQRNFNLLQFNPICTPVIAANVGGVHVQGVELEFMYMPIPSVTMNAAVAYTDAKVAATVPGVNDSLGKPLEKGDAIENVAPLTVSAGAEYRFATPYLSEHFDGDYSGFVRVDWRYVGERMGLNTGDKASLRADPIRSQFIADPYQLTDLRLGVTSEEWSAWIYASNLFNEKAIYDAYRISWLPTLHSASVSDPRTIGFSLERRF